MKNLRKLVSLMAVGFLIVLLVGGSSGANQQIVLRYWHNYSIGTTPEGLALDHLISKFEADHPNIKVEAQQLPYDEVRRKLITSLFGGMAPDMLRMDIIWVPEFADMGALVSMGKEFSDFQSYAEETFEGPLSTCCWRGDYYGIPLDTNTRVLFWNKEMFDAVGIQGPPTNWTEFARAVKALTKDTDGDGEIDQWGFAMNGTWPWNFFPWLWSGGGAVTDPEITQASGYLDSKKSIAALKFIVDLYKEGALSPTILGGGIGTWEGYAKNKHGMIVSGPWGFPIIHGQYPEKEINIALIPAGPGENSSSVIGGEDIVIFKQSKYKEDTWEFVKFMVSEYAQTVFAKAGQMPILKSLTESLYIQEHEFYPVFLEQMKTAKARLPHPNWEKIKDEIKYAVESAVRGVMSPDQALGKAATEIDQLLK